MSARKLAILFWCLLTRGEDYAHRTTVADPQETPAAQAHRGRTPTRPPSRRTHATRELMRTAERELAQQAEASYRMVTDQLAGRPAKRRVGASATPERTEV